MSHKRKDGYVINGRTYWHRVVAAVKLGRNLRRHEVVHHIDGNPSNNHPDNLEVLPSRWHHNAQHRRKPTSKSLRLPGEANPWIVCACGCGVKLRKFDSEGRPRRVKHGHSGANYK